MFFFAFIIGIYSYLIFFLGVFHLLYSLPVAIVTLIFALALAIYLILRLRKFTLKKQSTLWYILLVILLLQMFVNLIGALGPELAFDALWYHLTLPKLYILAHTIYHIPGGLLYYSDMPKIGEMLYIPSLMFGNEITAKLIHYSFGIFSCVVLYTLARRYLSSFFSILTVLLFYTNLVVGFESITAFSDLVWTFYATLALLAFAIWSEEKTIKWLIVCALMSGFAITAKLVAIAIIPVYVVLLVYLARKQLSIALKQILYFVIISLLIPMPWFIFSYGNTRNPVYPFFTSAFASLQSSTLHTSMFNPMHIIEGFLQLFARSADPISPIYLMFLPLIVVFYKQLDKKLTWMVWYIFLAILIWYLTPQTGGARFFMPYLPAFSLLCVDILTKLKGYALYKPLLGVILVVCILNIGYRASANAKFIPVVFDKETKAEFLTKDLNFAFGDFYDTDGYFAKTMQPSDTVLLSGFHNLYYVNFPFIDSSWVKKGDEFDYIAVQNGKPPKQFSSWKEVYKNPITHVAVYTK